MLSEKALFYQPFSEDMPIQMVCRLQWSTRFIEYLASRRQCIMLSIYQPKTANASSVLKLSWVFLSIYVKETGWPINFIPKIRCKTLSNFIPKIRCEILCNYKGIFTNREIVGFQNWKIVKFKNVKFVVKFWILTYFWKLEWSIFEIYYILAFRRGVISNLMIWTSEDMEI